MLQNIGALSVKFFGAIISYVLTIYISRYFGNEVLGYFSFFLSYSLVFTLFMKFGTDIFCMKWVSYFTASGEEGKAIYIYFKLLRYHLLAGGAITIAGFLLTPYIIQYFFSRYDNTLFFQISILSVFFVNLHILNYEFLRGKQQVIAYTFYHTTAIFLMLVILNVLLDFFSLNFPNRFAITYLAAAIISFVASVIHVRVATRHHQAIRAEGFNWKYIFNNSTPYFSNNAVIILMGTLDVFILSRYITPAALGEYALLVKFANFVSFPMVVMNANFAPKLLHFSDRALLSREIKSITALITVAATAIFFGVLIILEPVTSYLNFSSENGYWVYVLISIGFLFSAFCSMNEVCLTMLGEERLFQTIMLSALVLNCVLICLLVPLYKEKGAAFANMLTLIFWNLAAVYYSRKRLQIKTALFQ
jgi:O-antigen/teichoic acid export membrane protein